MTSFFAGVGSVARGLSRAFLFIVWTAGMAVAWWVCRMTSSPVAAPRAPRARAAGNTSSPRAAGHRSSRGAKALHVWARGVCRVLGLRVEVAGTMCRAPALYVGNHVGYLDIIVLAATAPALFVSKDDLAHWPVLGFLAASVGTIFLDRTQPRAVIEAGERMAALFARDVSVIVFPEGTTTDGRDLAAFHPALFEPALRAREGDGIPVQAIAIRYEAGAAHDLAVWTDDATFLPHFWKLLRARDIRANVWCAPPVTGFADRRAAAAETRAWITSVVRRVRRA